MRIFQRPKTSGKLDIKDQYRVEEQESHFSILFFIFYLNSKVEIEHSRSEGLNKRNILKKGQGKNKRMLSDYRI